jgi:hypothetical protein
MQQGGARPTASRESARDPRLAEWLRDSTVLDSVTRTVPTDSLYHIFRTALGPKGTTSEHIRQMVCEQVRLGIRYGHVPAARAFDRMLDTVYNDRNVPDAYGEFMYRAPKVSAVDTGDCQSIEPGSATLGRTRLDQELPPRPVRPGA